MEVEHPLPSPMEQQPVLQPEPENPVNSDTAAPPSLLDFRTNVVGQLFAVYERVSNMLGIPSCSKKQSWQSGHVNRYASVDITNSGLCHTMVST